MISNIHAIFSAQCSLKVSKGQLMLETYLLIVLPGSFLYTWWRCLNASTPSTKEKKINKKIIVMTVKCTEKLIPNRSG